MVIAIDPVIDSMKQFAVRRIATSDDLETAKKPGSKTVLFLRLLFFRQIF